MKKNYFKSILLFFIVIGYSSLTDAQIITDGTYKILNSVNSQVISINTLAETDPNNPDGLIIGRSQMADADSSDNFQLWSFVHQVNDVYKITNIGDNTILGIKDGWCGDFGDVQVGFDSSSLFTLIKVTAAGVAGTYVFQIAFDSDCNFGSTNSPIKAFDIDGGNLNGKLQTFPTDTANPNQQFQIVDPASLSIAIFNPLDSTVINYENESRTLFLESLNTDSTYRLQLFNLNGVSIYSNEIYAQENTQIDFSTIKNGLYFITIESDSGSAVKKVLIY